MKQVLQREWAIAAVLLVLATALRVPGLDESLWFDEVGYSTREWFSSLSDIWRLFLVDPPAPLYRLVLLYWTGLAGQGDLAVRMPSLIFGLASVLLTYGIARAYGTRGTAILAAVLLALSPVHVWYSQEATPYAMMLCFLLAAIYLWTRLKTDRPTPARYAAYLACFLVAVFTHYFAAIFLAPLSIAAFFMQGGTRNRVLLLNGVVALSLGVALATKYLLGDIQSGMGWLRSFDLFEWWMLFFNWFAHGNALWTVNPYRATKLEFGYLADNPFLVLFQFIVLVGLLSGLFFYRKRGRGTQVWELSLFLLSPPLIMLVVTLADFRHLYIERYLLTALPFFCIALARGATAPRSPGFSAACIALAAAVGAASYGAFLHKGDTWTVYKPNPDWKSAAHYLAERGSEYGPPVVLNLTPVNALVFYLKRAGKAQEYQFMYYNEELIPKLSASDVGAIHLVRNRFWKGDFDKALKEMRADPGVRLIVSRSFKGVDFYIFLPAEKAREQSG